MLLLVALLAASLSAEPLRLDAGDLVSPVLDGFARLHPGGSDDPRARWDEPPHTVKARHGPDPLTSDHLEGGSLHLDLAPGRWSGWVLLGQCTEDPAQWAGTFPLLVQADGHTVFRHKRDQAWDAWVGSTLFAANPRPVFREEETAFDRQVLPGRPWRPITVEVDDDGVSLTWRGSGLMAVLLWPEAQAIEADIDRLLVDTRRRTWFTRYRSPEQLAPAPRVDPGPLAASWWRDELGLDVVADEVWSPGMLRDDRVHRLLAVQGGDGPGTVTVSAPPGVEVTVREAVWLDTAGHPSRSLRPRPTWLDAEGAWQGGQGVPPVLSVVVSTAPDTPVGPAPVVLHLARDGERLDVPLRPRVVPLTAPAAIPTGLFVQVPQHATAREGFASEPVVGLLDATLDLLAEHGLRALALRYATWPDWLLGDEGLDDRLIRHAATTWRALGGGPMVWSDLKAAWRGRAFRRGLDPLTDDTVAPVTQGLATAAELDLVVHAWEEEAWQGLTAIDRGADVLGALRRAAPAPVRLMGTLPTTADQLLAGLVDVGLVTGPPSVLTDGVRRVRAAGTSPWAYNLWSGRAGPWLAWAAGAEAHLQWHADPRTGDPFDDTAAPQRWHHVLVGPDGVPHATVRLEALAAGVADTRVLAATAAGPARDRRWAAQVSAWVLGLEPLPDGDGEPWPLAAPDQLRDAAITRLERRGALSDRRR